MNTKAIDRFDDRTVLRVLSEATTELRELSPQESTGLGSAGEAQQALQLLLTSNGFDAAAAELADLTRPAIARNVLARMVDDSATSTTVTPLVNDPPMDGQKSLETAATAAIILGALIAWLQTSAGLVIKRKGGQTDFSFELHKRAASNEVVKDAAQQVAKMLAG